MGQQMDKVLPNLYLGSHRDMKDYEQINKNKITHILSIHELEKVKLHDTVTYLTIDAEDDEDQDLQQYFSKCFDFIHKARNDGGNVLVHCMAGVSRSATICIAYIMVVTDLSWLDAMNSVKGAREIVEPNPGFQGQLEIFGRSRLKQEKNNLMKTYGKFKNEDTEFAKKLLDDFKSKQKTKK